MDCKEPEESEKKPAIILRFKRTSCIKDFECAACPKSYKVATSLKYHTRREHYNLLPNIRNRARRQINDVWLERVLNSDDVIEIKKTGHNKYSMKKAGNPDHDDIAETIDTIDLTPLYPGRPGARPTEFQCYMCKKEFVNLDYSKHLEDDHGDLLM